MNRCIAGVLLASLLLPDGSSAGPWFSDLEESISELPWVVVADILEAGSDGVTALVTRTFSGDHVPGDTLRLDYWELGSWMSEAVAPGEGMLLVPDTTGALQMVGSPGQGYWLLRGYFDFNAFWVNPGVISPEELRMICSGDTIPDRTVDVDIRFAGSSRFIPMRLRESAGAWTTESTLSCLDDIRLDSWKVALGGNDAFPWEPEVEIILPTESGGLMKFSGRVTGFEEGVYGVIAYPTGPMILDPHALADYMEGVSIPSPPVIDVEIHGADPADLGLTPNPYLTTGESGRLHLSGSEGLLDITSIYQPEGYYRPLMGFDMPMVCSDPLYFDFHDLPPGPSGNLATDIIDALAKGYVSGDICLVPGEPLARFTLFMTR